MKARFVKLLLGVCFVIGGTLMVACSEDEVNPEVSVEVGKDNFFEKSMDFSSNGGQQTLSFTTNVDWTLSVSSTQGGASWCSVSQSSGSKGQQSVTVKVDKNEGYDDRNVVIVLTAGEITKNVIVNQKQKNAITLTTDRFEIGNEGGKIDIEVKANVDYSVEIPEQYRSWISQSTKTRALSTSKVSLNIEENSEYDKREGEILIKSGELLETVKVYQSGNVVLVLSQNEYTLGSEGGEVSVEISSNFEFEVDMPSVDWVKEIDKTRAVSSHTLVYTVSPNETYDDREAVIVFRDAKTDKKESVTIKQRQKNAILLANDKVEIPQEGGEFSVEVNSNVDYSIEIPSKCSGWISQKGTRALSTTTPTFYVASSEEYDLREGEIIFKYGELSETLKVYQSGGAVILLGQSSYNLEGGATTITVQLKSNIEYSVSVADDWISEVSTRAVSSSSKTFNIAANKTGSSRTGKIKFTTSDGVKSAEVTVTQKTIVEAKSLSINFSYTSGHYGGYLYIGKNYNFSVDCTPSNASVNYEWEVENPNIATISGSGRTATLYTKDYGKTKVTVTETNTGIKESYEIGTCVTDFQFTNNTGETAYGYPAITLVVGESHQLKYSCVPNYATNVFSNLKSFKFKEVIGNIFAMVDESTIVDIDPSGLMTAKKVGQTIIQVLGDGVYKKDYDTDGVYVNVISEYSEKEYNNDFSTANRVKIGQTMKFGLSNSNDIDVFKFDREALFMNFDLEYLGGWNYIDWIKTLRWEMYDENYSLTGSGTLGFKGTGEVYRTMSAYAGYGKVAYLRFYFPSDRDSRYCPDGYFKLKVTPKE